jgi:hypothetical protein
MAVITRQLLGVLLYDLPIYVPALLRGGDACLTIRNRKEQLLPAPDASGFRCNWQWSSDLHAPKILPALGRKLMRRALALHPIRQAKIPPEVTASASPEVSFLIGHRGTSRLPHLLATLETIAAQQGAVIECVVVEQDAISQLGSHLPPWVRLIHTPLPEPDMPYCRAWAFNVAVRHARAPVLILHDNDMLVPADYAAQILQRVAQGYEVVNLKRFVFYLTPTHTSDIVNSTGEMLDTAPEAIVQNLEGGGSVAITRAAFDQIGGMDESFVGWGGEDNEFWERAETLQVWPWANLPMVHLWHEPQPGKDRAEQTPMQRYRELRRIDARLRILELRQATLGNESGPFRTGEA